MIKKWLTKERPSADRIADLAQSINVQEALACLLYQRGITNFDEAKSFFRPQLSDLHDPFLMKDMDKAVDRLEEAIQHGEKILVYGDYDVDGTTSVALFYTFLKRLTDEVEFYIPDRYQEGYGISRQGIDYADAENFKLIVSLDCGVKAVALIGEAKSRGIDFIVCDHHRPGDELPAAVAVLDPKREDCEYPYKELSGAGVGFKLVQAMAQRLSIDMQEIYPLLDLVAVSIASDIVPISGENRILAFYGLKKLNQSARPGLKALMKVSGLQQALTITNIVFSIGPRINAAGRIGHAKNAVKLLIAEDQKKVEKYLEGIEKNNTDRKQKDLGITKEALEMIASDLQKKHAKSTVLYKEDWHKGVIGIVASRCIERYYRPTIILTSSDDKATGSARSVRGFDVYEAIEKCAHHLEQYGGHTYAAGVTLKKENIPAFQEAFEKVVAENITEEQLIPGVEIDLEVDLDMISERFFNILSQMEPFGPGNMKPVFKTENLHLIGDPKLLKKKHLKFHVAQENKNNSFEVIAFGFGDHQDYYERLCLNRQKIRLAYTIEINHFQGDKKIQLQAKDIEFYDV
ncbi:MAG: single-stranded-DNA-specific exonuclease RecJ [Cyclobacteriaceae bacterium]|nr:single-stranded-DNA-specific exonuclease RecJ [Cyclobacteriaceae bacterium]MCH8515032.1 single-stranded-DNA-specific exonuclease RecJ [Cyclobacteriaceae bacterium]